MNTLVASAPAALPRPNEPGSVGIDVSVTSDVDEQAALLVGWAQEYHQISPGDFSGRLSHAYFGEVRLLRETTTQRIHQEGASSSNSIAFVTPQAVSELCRWRGAQFDSHDVACIYGSDEIDFLSAQHCDLLAVSVNSSDFDAYAAQVDGRDITRRFTQSQLLKVAPKCQAEFKELLRSMLLTTIASPALLHQSQVQISMREVIYSKLIDMLEMGGNSPVLEYPGRRYALVARARQYLNDHRDEPIRLADICRFLSISERSLQYAFQMVTGINPIAYMRAFRLNGVRREIKSGVPDMEVLDVAARWGFWHPSHFSADYKRMFGELPSTTLRRCAR